MVHSWNPELSSSALIIDELRLGYVAKLRPIFTELAEELLGVRTGLEYRRGWPMDQTLGEVLASSRDRDARVKVTAAGPHRADLGFAIDGEPARDRISRGQQKMLATAFVLSQVKLAAENRNEPTCLLLDDPAAELDVDNLGKLLEVIQKIPAQLVVTSLSIAGLRGIPVRQRFHVEQGRFTAML
jgi:DNA replication and repair protein RecF